MLRTKTKLHTRKGAKIRRVAVDPARLDWRKLERELIQFAKSEGFYADQSSKTGDVTVHINDQVNLTELAKALAERLS